MVLQSFVDDFIAGSLVRVIQKRDLYSGCKVLLIGLAGKSLDGVLGVSYPWC